MDMPMEVTLFERGKWVRVLTNRPVITGHRSIWIEGVPHVTEHAVLRYPGGMERLRWTETGGWERIQE